MTKNIQPFTVNGKFIDIHSQEQDALDAALKHADTKYKLFAFRGSPENQKALAARSVRLGLDTKKIQNPELGDFIRNERLAFEKEKRLEQLQTPKKEMDRDVKAKQALGINEHDRITAENIEPRVFKRDGDDLLVSNFRVPYDAQGRTKVDRIAAVEKHIEKLEAFSQAALVAGSKHISERAALQIKIERLDHLEIKSLERDQYLRRLSDLQQQLAKHDLQYPNEYTKSANDRLDRFAHQHGKEQTMQKKPQAQDISQSTNPFLFRETLNADQRRRYEALEKSVKDEMRERRGLEQNAELTLMMREQQLLNQEFLNREEKLKSGIDINKPAKLENSQTQETTVKPKAIGESDLFRGLKIGKDIHVVDRQKLEEDLQQQL